MWAGAFGSVFRTDWSSPVVLCGVAPHAPVGGADQGARRWCCAALRLLGLLRFVSALPGVGLWSKMRLGYAPFGRVGAGVVQKASQFGGFGQIQAISGRLRRILDQAPGKTPDPPETQTPFGPPGRRVTGSLGHQLVVPQGHRPTGLPGRLGGRQRALFRLRGLCRVAYAGLARGPRRVEPSGADSPAGEPPRGLRTHIPKRAPASSG